MNIEDLCRLIQVVTDSNLSDFTYEEGGVRISMASKRSEKEAVFDDRPLPGEAEQKETGCPKAGAGRPVPGAKDPQAGAEGSEERAGGSGSGAGDRQGVGSQSEPEGRTLDSPLVGIFYAAPSETEAPFVQVGDWVKQGQIIAIVEAMKLMNEIECDCDGQVTEILVQNGQTVEYGQPLIRVLPQ